MSDAPLESGTSRHSCPGTIVLASSLHVLLIDRQAATLLRMLDSPLAACDPAITLPSSLVTVAQEIADRSRTPGNDAIQGMHSTQCVIGTAAQRIRIQGFGLRPSNGNNGRIVLVLSQLR